MPMTGVIGGVITLKDSTNKFYINMKIQNNKIKKNS